MARPTLFLLTLGFRSVLGSIASSSSVPSTILEVPAADRGLPAAQEPAADVPVFKDIQPYSSWLPLPPVPLGQEAFTGTLVLQQRTFQKVGNFNKPRQHPLTDVSHTEFEVIPPGMRKVWATLINELGWFKTNPAEYDILLSLFHVMLEDDYSKFIAFEAKFVNIFAVGYAAFTKNSRSVLGWLIAFGSVNIISSIENMSHYIINDDILELSIKHLVYTHPLDHVASMIDLIPFFSLGIMPQGQNLFLIVFTRPGSDNIDNLAALLSKMKVIKVIHLAFISFIARESNNMINLCFQVNQVILTTTSTNLDQERRIVQSRKFKDAFQQFLHMCLNDYKKIENIRVVFALAHLFIEFDNLEGLLKLFESHPEIVSALSNGKTLLQTAIDLGSFNCASHMAKIYPRSVFMYVNGTQSPFVQSIISNNLPYFQAFLEELREDKPIAFFDGVDLQSFDAQTLAIVYDRREMLHAIVTRIASLDGKANLRHGLDAAIVLKSKNYRDIHGGHNDLRTSNLISNDIWAYLLLEDAEFDYGVYNDRRLIDLAIIDRNVAAARIISEKPGFQINESISNSFLIGNCSWLIRNDTEMLKFLVGKGLDVDGVVFRKTFEGTWEKVSILAILLEKATEEFAAEVRALGEI